MALKRPKVEKDPRWKIETRARMKPEDFTLGVKYTAAWLREWHPRWVNKNERRIAEVLGKGYIYVTRDEVTAPDPLLIAGDKTSTNYIIHGDLILMKCPKQDYDQRQMDNVRYSFEQIQDSYDNLEDQVERGSQGKVKVKQKLTIKSGKGKSDD